MRLLGVCLLLCLGLATGKHHIGHKTLSLLFSFFFFVSLLLSLCLFLSISPSFFLSLTLSRPLSLILCTPFGEGKRCNDGKIRGVNLGGWLVLEEWMTPALFEYFQNSYGGK